MLAHLSVSFELFDVCMIYSCKSFWPFLQFFGFGQIFYQIIARITICVRTLYIGLGCRTTCFKALFMLRSCKTKYIIRAVCGTVC